MRGRTERLNGDSIERMRYEIGGFISNLSDAVSVNTGISKRYSRIVISGMGASAIGGEIFANCLYYYPSKLRIMTAKTMALPGYVDDETLFVACSYSGNTLETVSLYEMAIERRLDVIAVTAGGKLEELSKKNDNMIVKIGGEKIQPRSAIGWFIGILSAIIEDAGGPSLRYEIRSMIPELEKLRGKLEDNESIAHSMVKKLNGRTPVIYAVPDMSAVAVRWKQQINENSKLVAFSGEIPEFNHNEVVGWMEDKLRCNFLPVVLENDASQIITDALQATLATFDDVGGEYIRIKFMGRTELERAVRGIMVGDYASLYLAEHLDKDPMDVKSITKIKGNLKTNRESRKRSIFHRTKA